MKLFRRVISAITLAGLIGAAIRVRGTGGTPPQHGGWRPLDIAGHDVSGSDRPATRAES